LATEKQRSRPRCLQIDMWAKEETRGDMGVSGVRPQPILCQAEPPARTPPTEPPILV
jgi:hypothetical protein